MSKHEFGYSLESLELSGDKLFGFTFPDLVLVPTAGEEKPTEQTYLLFVFDTYSTTRFHL